VDELLPALAQEGADLAVAVQAHDVEHYQSLLPGVALFPGPAAIDRPPVRLAWEQAGLPALVRRSGADVLHSPHYTMPLAARVPVVTTLHDVTFFTHPDVHLPVKRHFFRAWTRISLRRAQRCVVPSQATCGELARVAGADRDRIDVAHHGVDPRTFSVPGKEARSAARRHLGLRSRRYVAFLGTIEPRKNVSQLIEGWVQAVADMTDPPALVVAGGRGWDERVDEVVQQVPQGLELLLPGYLPLDLLAGFLGGADVVAYPSTAEGFGLPVLEGMACGAPVLTTTSLALPEVGGDAVAYVQPTAAGIAEGLRGLLADEERRRQLSHSAVQRAAGFTWSACAQQHLRSYARAVDG
jgi:glycosyltransferase involved in cell wall biosynthesis